MSIAEQISDVLAGRSRWCVVTGDCLDVLRTIPSGSVDAVVTDPPYYRVKDEDWDRQWDSADDFVEWLGVCAEGWRACLRANGSLYVFASPEMAARVEVQVVGPKFFVLNSIRWVKEQGWHRKAERETLRSFLSPWEAIIFAEQRGDAYGKAERCLHKDVYAPIGRRVQQVREAAGLARHEVDTACSPSRKPTGLCYRWEEGACLPTLDQWVALARACGDRREYEDLRREYEDLRRPFLLTPKDEPGDIWAFSPVMGYDGKHPCEKPVSMMRFIVRVSCRADAVVIDPFCGSGATGVACMQEGRRFIGIELDPGYADIARRRIGEAAKHLFANTLGQHDETPRENS